jgi:hypothetical protein
MGGNPALLEKSPASTGNLVNQNPTTGDKQNPTSSSSSSSSNTKAAKAFVLPEWIDKDAWQGFEEMRNSKRKPMTARARGLVVKQLEKLRAAGNDVTACLNQSTMKSYLDVYPVKPDTQFSGSSSSASKPSRYIDPTAAYSGSDYTEAA